MMMKKMNKLVAEAVAACQVAVTTIRRFHILSPAAQERGLEGWKGCALDTDDAHILSADGRVQAGRRNSK